MEGKLSSLQAALDEEMGARADLQAELVSVKAQQQVRWFTGHFLAVFRLQGFPHCGAMTK